MELKGVAEVGEVAAPTVNGFLNSNGIAGEATTQPNPQSDERTHPAQLNGGGAHRNSYSDASMDDEAEDDFAEQATYAPVANGSIGTPKSLNVQYQSSHQLQQQGFPREPFSPQGNHQLTRQMGFHQGCSSTSVATMRLRTGMSRQASEPAYSTKVLNQRQPHNRSIDSFDARPRSRRQEWKLQYWMQDFYCWLRRYTRQYALFLVGALMILLQLTIWWQINNVQSQTAVVLRELHETRHELNQKFYLFESTVATNGIKQQTIVQSITKMDNKVGDIDNLLQSLNDKVHRILASEEEDSGPKRSSGGLFSSFGFGSVDDEKSRFMLDDELVDEDVLERWRDNLQDLRSSYPSQSREFWTQLSAAVESTMSTDVPSKPASIVVLSKSASDGSIALGFANSLASSINTAFDPKYQNVKQLSVTSLNQVDSISRVHDDLKTYLNSQGKAVVVENIEDFRRTEHLYLFHAFCENSNQLAYDTRASFIFTMKPASFVESQYEWTHWEGQRIVRESLQLGWRSALDDDKRDAVISRVCAYVVLFNDSDDSPHVM